MITDAGKKTKDTYGFLWSRRADKSVAERWHFNAMQDAVGTSIVRGKMGIDIGSGCGYDTYIMARSNPGVTIVSIDISEGVYSTAKFALILDNIKAIRCSFLEVPLKGNSFDFAYSFGALHHTDRPEKGLLEIARILKKSAPCFLYLYEDHSENPVKYAAIRVINILRHITARFSPKVLYVLSCFASPFVFILFSLPSKALMRFKLTRVMAGRMPFNFATGIFSLRGDLYDRFGAPVERRFSRRQVYDMFIGAGFYDINITRINDRAGWVAWGRKV